MNLSIVRRKKKRKTTNEKDDRKRIPTKKQRLRIKVTNAGRFGLAVEDVTPKALETFETEGDTDERPLKSSKKQKRFVERSKMPAKRRSRNKR